MASISTDSRGGRIIQFVGADKRRRSVRLGKLDMRTVREVADRIDALNVARIAGTQISRDLAEWLSKTTDWLHDKLEAVGLAEPRSKAKAVPMLGEFVAEFLAKRDGIADAAERQLNATSTPEEIAAFYAMEPDQKRELLQTIADQFDDTLNTKHNAKVRS